MKFIYFKILQCSPYRCCISTVHADSIAHHHGVEEGDKILAPRIASGEEVSNVYELFQSASKHCPLLFEINAATSHQQAIQIFYCQDAILSAGTPSLNQVH
jgi:hypothetical protein